MPTLRLAFSDLDWFAGACGLFPLIPSRSRHFYCAARYRSNPSCTGSPGRYNRSNPEQFDSRRGVRRVGVWYGTSPRRRRNPGCRRPQITPTDSRSPAGFAAQEAAWWRRSSSLMGNRALCQRRVAGSVCSPSFNRGAFCLTRASSRTWLQLSRLRTFLKLRRALRSPSQARSRIHPVHSGREILEAQPPSAGHALDLGANALHTRR